MDVRYLNGYDWAILDNYIRAKKEANIYHSWQWQNILKNSYNFTPVYLAAFENDVIQGFLPLFRIRNLLGQKKLVSLPYSHMVPLLYNSKRAFNAILLKAESVVRDYNAKFLVIKSDLKALRPGWKEFSDNYLSVLELKENSDLVKKNIKNSTLRNIKKAEKENVKIRIGRTIQDFKNFYELMVDTRHRQGSPPYPYKFFESLYWNFNEKQIRLFQAFKNNLLLGGIIILYFGNRAIYAYGASVNDRMLLRSRPNELLFWTAIKDACKKKYTVFDFGITPFYNKNLLHFKSRWGTTTYEIPYTYFPSAAKSNKPSISRNAGHYRLASALLTKTPRPIIKHLGPQMLKYLGY